MIVKLRSYREFFSSGESLPKGQAGECFTLRFFWEALVLWRSPGYQFLTLE